MLTPSTRFHPNLNHLLPQNNHHTLSLLLHTYQLKTSLLIAKSFNITLSFAFCQYNHPNQTPFVDSNTRSNVHPITIHPPWVLLHPNQQWLCWVLPTSGPAAVLVHGALWTVIPKTRQVGPNVPFGGSFCPQIGLPRVHSDPRGRILHRNEWKSRLVHDTRSWLGKAAGKTTWFVRPRLDKKCKQQFFINKNR